MVVTVSGEAILSAENSGKPSGGRVPPRTPLGSSQRSPRPSSWSGEGLLPTPPRTPPCCPPWALRSCPNEKSYARPRRDLSLPPPRRLCFTPRLSVRLSVSNFTQNYRSHLPQRFTAEVSFDEKVTTAFGKEVTRICIRVWEFLKGMFTVVRLGKYGTFC